MQLVLLLQQTQLLLIDRRNGDVLEVVTLMEEVIGVVVDATGDTCKDAETDHVAYEEGLSGADHCGGHFEGSGVLVA